MNERLDFPPDGRECTDAGKGGAEFWWYEGCMALIEPNRIALDARPDSAGPASSDVSC